MDFGWLAVWNTESIFNGTYTLENVASHLSRPSVGCWVVPICSPG